MSELTFEWDDEKNILNKTLHGIDFEEARFVFNDPNKVILSDIYHSDFEERWLVIGMAHKMLFVVYTERGERIRLISARRATKQEEDLYNDYNQ